jgi:hypothetical protein
MFIFLGGPPGPSNTRDDKKEKVVVRKGPLPRDKPVIGAGKPIRAAPLLAQPPSPFCHPERTRISYSPATTYVVLPKENHIQLTEATALDRKIRGSRGICGSADLSWKCFSAERASPLVL